MKPLTRLVVIVCLLLIAVPPLHGEPAGEMRPPAFFDDPLGYIAPDSASFWIGTGRLKKLGVVDTVAVWPVFGHLEYVSIVSDTAPGSSWNQTSRGKFSQPDSTFLLTSKTGFWPTVTLSGVLDSNGLLFGYELGPLTVSARLRPLGADSCDVHVWFGRTEPDRGEGLAELRFRRVK